MRATLVLGAVLSAFLLSSCASGIPVRYEFGQQVDRAAVLATFGLREGVPILLISAGAAGGAYALRIVQQMQDRTEPFQAVVVCGHNADLKQDVDALVRHDTDRVLSPRLGVVVQPAAGATLRVASAR